MPGRANDSVFPKGRGERPEAYKGTGLRVVAAEATLGADVCPEKCPGMSRSTGRGFLGDKLRNTFSDNL